MKVIRKDSMGSSDLGWLKSRFHFSFADYYNPQNMNFGVLRVLNDDLVAPATGFDLHPHRDMEIISYVVDGELTHQDSMGHKKTLTRGMMQYMSAGTGVMHSEHNLGSDTARFIQIWIIPEKKGLTPAYGDYEFDWDARKGEWLHMVSSYNGEADIKIHQDVNIFSLEMDAGSEKELSIKKSRQAYLVHIEGETNVNNVLLSPGDAVELVEEEVVIKSITKSHYLLIEMKYQ